jgi:hypothetical protein
LTQVGSWTADWLWSLPLIVLTVLMHGFGLMAIREDVVPRLKRTLWVAGPRLAFATVITTVVLLLTVLHTIEGGVWALSYVALGASPDAHLAMLYSLSAMTAYGHADVFLDHHWQMMGALEALDGLMLFGLTTAFLFWVLLNNWPARRVSIEPRPKAAPQ